VNKNNAKKKYTFDILDGNIGYLAYNQCQDYKAFDRFLKKTFQRIEKNGVDQLIIDIRKNSGGNSTLNDLLLNYITRKPYQQVYGRYWKVSDQVKEQIQTKLLWSGFLPEDFLQQYLNANNQSVIKEFDDVLSYPDSSNLFFTGTTCVLIGPKTFSNANYLADAIKTYSLSPLIGLPIGEYTGVSTFIRTQNLRVFA
jgi:C-terminal processing protease CtpA/Prc